MNDAEKVLSVFNSSSSHRVGSIQKLKESAKVSATSRYYKKYQILKNPELTTKHETLFSFLLCPHMKDMEQD